MKNDWIGWTKHHPEEDDLAMMKWNDEKTGGKAFQPWREFDHPQLGKVEIGGWDTKGYIQNAPPDYLPELCEKQCAFTLAHALMSPRLEFKEARVEEQNEGVYKLSIVVANRGFLPTYTSQRAQERKAVRPIEVSVRLPAEATIVTGKATQEIGHLEGRTNKIYGGWFSSRNVTDNESHLEWVVRAPSGGEVQIEVKSDRAGTIMTRLPL
jgi:murein tripeptide amidase MpaA